jgi:hypothetical protein
MSVCLTRHVIMTASPNASVTTIKTLAVVSDMSHIWSNLTCLGPRTDCIRQRVNVSSNQSHKCADQGT